MILISSPRTLRVILKRTEQSNIQEVDLVEEPKKDESKGAKESDIEEEVDRGDIQEVVLVEEKN